MLTDIGAGLRLSLLLALHRAAVTQPLVGYFAFSPSYCDSDHRHDDALSPSCLPLSRPCHHCDAATQTIAITESDALSSYSGQGPSASSGIFCIFQHHCHHHHIIRSVASWLQVLKKQRLPAPRLPVSLRRSRRGSGHLVRSLWRV